MKVTRLISSAALLALFVLVARTTAAQQAVSAAPLAPVTSVAVSAPRAQPGPRLTPEFQRAEPTLARSATSDESSVAAAEGQHTIVISTLVLVLLVIIIVLLAK